MNIGCGTVLFRKFPLERALEAIRQIGYRYFETQAVGPWCPHVDVNRDDPEQLVKLQKAFGFDGITGLSTLDGNLIANDSAVASTIRSIEWAAAAGIPVVHAGDGHKPKTMGDDEAFGVLEEKLAKILEAAKKNHVTLAIEPHGTFSLTLSGLQRILSLGSPDVLAVNYDAANIHRAAYVESGNNKSGWQQGDEPGDELAILQGIADRVVHMHAKDLDAQGHCVALGQGEVHVAECVSYLRGRGYTGVVSVETEGGDDFDAIVKLAADSYAYLNKLI